jgi:hypothetical protein
MNAEFIYEPEFPHEDVSVDEEKLSALHSVVQTYFWHIVGHKDEFDDDFIRSLQLLEIDSIDAALQFSGELGKIDSAINEIENLSSRLAHWRAEKKNWRDAVVFQNDSMSLGPLSETIDLLRADYYVYSAYLEGTNSKWSVLREPIKLFNDVATKFFSHERCYLFGAGMRRAATAFFAYKALCEKYGVEKIDGADSNSPFRIECTRVHRLFSLGIEDFVSELDEKYDTFEMLKLASRQKDWLPSNWEVGPTTLSDGKRLLSNHQLICSLLGVARGLFEKHGESVMRDMPWMATFMAYNSACWLTVHIYQSLPSFKGKTVVALPLSDNVSKEGKELIDDMVNLFRFAQLDMFALESDTRNFMAHCIYELFTALEAIPRVAILDDNNDLIDTIYNFKSIVSMFFGFFDHRKKWSHAKAMVYAKLYKGAGRKAVDALSKACYRLELKTARQCDAKTHSEGRTKSRKPRVVDNAKIDAMRMVQELIAQLGKKFQECPIPAIVHGFDEEGANELRREVKSVDSGSRAMTPTKPKKPKRGRIGSGLKGKRTERMVSQLGDFKMWLINNPINERRQGCKVGERAKQFWLSRQKTFVRDAKREGEKKGFGSAKALAAAYRNSKH